MGCCASVSSRDEPHPQDDGDINDPRTPNPRPIISDSSQPASNRRQSRRARSNFPLSQHYNEPVRLHVWCSKRRTWTRAELDRERNEFFETRVTGRPEVWAALSTAISLLRTGDLATAQSIVDAAGVTIPTGDLCEGCYDEQGVLYHLPQCIVSDPENIVGAASSVPKATIRPSEQEGDPDALSNGNLATDDTSGDELITQDLERRRDEKGKTSERDLIRVQARLSDREGPDLVLLVGKCQSVGFLARKVHQEAEISNRFRVRIAYLGHMLREHESLLDQGWQNGHVVNALIAGRPSMQ
ncbi:hypothetical protein N7492_003855 [Penicillium capsulatum]|uniref:DC-UbP/UBTD2 N-terminal domain-containing protein n=1 Tax=Penicillium capsulatum TaxID=69766 RepID=A0A9W9IPG5_9EURO|nr:hypothetical protein N7492_003855 [Penicillium capsulatum]KAJ6121563.1 hypothetical protein N7512_004028 [Penicillium capsulatum]